MSDKESAIIYEEKVKSRAKEIRESLGGTIFAFPIEEDNPFSAYAVVVYQEGMYFVYPRATNISEAALGVLTILEEFKKIGVSVNYEKDVRLMSYQAQMDAPDVTMRRLKKGNVSTPLIQKGEDFQDGNEETGPLLSARGILKMSYFEMVDDHNTKAIRFMDEYYSLLAMNRYGKTAAAIKREVSKMGKEMAIRWIEQTYKKFIKDPMDIFNIFNSIAGNGV
ncbi:MAG: hypothetical protein PHW39_02870 [Syntrophomonadaceae bacterium]|jgi:hypothetical protein|nr:hypothetical protein [Clostridia bacterium]MDD4562004.1 hypothetical protein [Syntrophomonadaceae bacterium]